MQSSLLHDLSEQDENLKMSNGRLNADLVHDLRVLTKQARAEALMLRPHSSGKVIKHTSKKLAEYLSVQRDAEMMLETFDALFKGRGRLCEIRKCLVNNVEHSVADAYEVRQLVDEMRSALFQFTSDRKEAVSLNQLIETFREKSLSLYAKTKGNQPKTYHDWRKTIKKYLYLLKLSSKTGKHFKRVKRLGEFLGYLHDLQVLDDFLRRRNQVLPESYTSAIQKKEAKLLRHIHSVASKTFA